MLKSVMHEVSIEGNKSNLKLTKLLDKIYGTLVPMLTKKGKLSSLLSPVAKKPKDDKMMDLVMVDTGMDTILTSNWWESEQE